MIDTFFAQREAAKKRKDESASYVYKIIMNSFYGVLGAPNCRFANPHIAGAITGFGRHLLQWTKERLEALGHSVLYGDTDSVFVALKSQADDIPQTAKELAQRLNQEIVQMVRTSYDVESRLELEFEKWYESIFFPSQRHGDTGRSKGYVGLRREGKEEKLDVVGMEAIRSDWTPLAKSLQIHLFKLLFAHTPAEKIQIHVKELVKKLYDGEFDDQLILSKRLRKPLSHYTKTTPPHVKAARLLSHKPGKTIRYYLTTRGPQPEGHIHAPLDYDYYFDKQLLPIIEMVAYHCGLDVNSLRSNHLQGSLFDGLSD